MQEPCPIDVDYAEVVGIVRGEPAFRYASFVTVVTFTLTQFRMTYERDRIAHR